MSANREFQRVTFGKKVDVKRLQAVLAKIMKETAKCPEAEAAPVRLESVLIEPEETTVHLSGNGPGLKVVAQAVKEKVTGSKVAKARRSDARRQPTSTRPTTSQTKKKR